VLLLLSQVFIALVSLLYFYTLIQLFGYPAASG